MNAFTLPDILCTLADNIDSQAQLAVLCRLSQRCRDIFTPVLYRRIWLYPRTFFNTEYSFYDQWSIHSALEKIYVGILL
jgi:hypothetical protein